MAVNWSAYKARLTTHGATERQRVIERTKEQIRRQVPYNPACREVLVDKIPQTLFITRGTVLKIKNFNTLPGETVPLGAVVYWDDRHWLVTESIQDDEMTCRGVLEQCNRELIWQNPETREIISRWCTIEKPYYANVEKDLEFSFSSREFKVQLPYDEESALIDVDKKFILEVINGQPKVYTVTSVDDNTERYDVNGEVVGFLALNLTQTQYNPERDSAEHGICDYLPPFDILHPTKTGYLVLEGGEDGIVPGSFPVTLQARYFNYSDGTPRNGESTIYHFNCSKAVRELMATKQHGNNITISLRYSPYIVGETIHIEAVNLDGTIGEKLDLKVVNSL